MTSPSLKIDTSVALASQSHHANTNSQNHSPGSAPLPDTSPQDPSPTTSALTLMSATASSADASTYSLILPQASIYSETTVDTHLSADMSPSEGSQPEYVLAMHDYIPEQRNATCLAFRAGQVIRVLNRDPSGWWDGELDGSRGWFPSNYVNGDLALLADDQLPQFISVRAFYLFSFLEPVIELTCLHYSESEHILDPVRLPQPHLPPVSFRLGRVPSLEMITAPLQWFHCFMHCHCCRTLFDPIG